MGAGKLGIFGGTSLLQSDIFCSLQPKTVSTPYGKAIIYIDPTGERPYVFIQRHHADGEKGAEAYNLPHVINYQANISAMVAEGVKKILAICSVGSLKKNLPVGTLVAPDDYFSIFCPPAHCFPDYRSHVIPAIDKKLRSTILETLSNNDFPTLHTGSAVYVQTTGPRFETKVEVRFLGAFGDIVGMTAANEATVAAEHNKPYAIVAMIDNMGHGLIDEPLTIDQFKEAVEKNRPTIERAVSLLLEKLTE